MSQINHFRIAYKGLDLLVRPLIPSDKEILKAYYSELSERTRYLRFFAVRNNLSEYQLNYFTNVDHVNHIAWGIMDETGKEHIPVGVARMVRTESQSETAEIAITVTDAYQKKGMGRMLFAIMNVIANDSNISILRHQVLSDNTFVLGWLERFGIVNQAMEDGIKIVDTDVLSNKAVFARYPEVADFRYTPR